MSSSRAWNVRVLVVAAVCVAVLLAGCTPAVVSAEKHVSCTLQRRLPC